jgi:hypothetical protein
LRPFLFAVALAAFAAPAAAQTIAITNARIHTVSGAVIERGTVDHPGRAHRRRGAERGGAGRAPR